MSVFGGSKERTPEKRSRDTRQEECARMAELPVDCIAPNPDQPRKSFDEDSIAELAASIARVGLIQPLVVRKKGGKYVLIAGERRLRAAKLLGLKTVNCVIDAKADEDSALIAIVENLQRKDLHFFEEAECYAALINKHGLTQEELARSVGKSQSFIANKLRLLKLSVPLREAVVASNISERHARSVLRLRDPDMIFEAISRIAKEDLSVAETERLVDKLLSEKKPGAVKVLRRPRIIRIFKDYRAFINSVNAACDLLRQSGLDVAVEQNDLENGVDIIIRVTQCAHGA